MEQTILQYIKQVLGIPQEDTDWDDEILMLINTAVAILVQLGVDLFDGVLVDETTVWPDFGNNVLLRSMSKTYVGNRVKTVFDPSPNTVIHNSLLKYIDELEQRISLLFSSAD